MKVGQSSALVDGLLVKNIEHSVNKDAYLYMDDPSFYDKNTSLSIMRS